MISRQANMGLLIKMKKKNPEYCPVHDEPFDCEECDWWCDGECEWTSEREAELWAENEKNS